MNNKKEFFEKLLGYKEDNIKAKKMKDDDSVRSFYSGLVAGMTEAYSILFQDDIRFDKNIINYSEESAIRFLKAKINDLKK